MTHVSPPTRALTVQQPWATAIIELGKDVENRSWPTSHTGRIWIHAGAKTDYDAPEFAWPPGWPLTSMPSGAIIGSVELVACVQGHESRWSDKGDFHWLLRDPVRLAAPVPCRGMLGLWRIPPEVAAALKELA